MDRGTVAGIVRRATEEGEPVYTYPRPEERHLHVEKVDVEGSCPECGAEALKAYPVLSDGGWWDVTKCQECLLSVERKPGPLFGSIELLTDLV